jgi:hypothetical protein
VVAVSGSGVVRGVTVARVPADAPDGFRMRGPVRVERGLDGVDVDLVLIDA